MPVLFFVAFFGLLLVGNALYAGILLLIITALLHRSSERMGRGVIFFCKALFLLTAAGIVFYNITEIFVGFKIGLPALAERVFGAVNELKTWLFLAMIFSATIIFRHDKKSAVGSIKINNRTIWGLLGGITIMGAILRFWHLGDLAPFEDEFSHIFSAKALRNGDPIYETRGWFINYILLWLFRVVGLDVNNLATHYDQSLFWMRFPSVMIGTITIPVFYFLGKRFNKTVGLLCAFLVAVLPLHIALSKFTREYVYFFFIFALDIVLLQKIIKDVWDGVATNNIIKKHRLTIIFLILQVIDGFFIEPDSTLKTIVFLLFSLAITIIGIYAFRHQKGIFTKKNLLFFLAAGIGMIPVFYKFSNHLGLHFNDRYFDLIAKSNQGNFFSSFFSFLPVAFAVGGSAIYLLTRKKKVPFTFLNLAFWGVNFIFFVFIFNRYVQIRYAYTYFIPLIVLAALGAYVLILFFKKYFGLPRFFGVVLFCALFLSPYNAIYAGEFKENDVWSRTTAHYNQEIRNLVAFLKQKNINSDTPIIITSAYVNIVQGYGNAKKIIIYDSTDTARFDVVRETIQTYPEGWMVLDWRRNGLWATGLPKENFYMGNIFVEKIEEIDKFTIYHWQK